MMSGTLDDEWARLSTKKEFYSDEQFAARKAYLSAMVDKHGWSAPLTSFEFCYPTEVNSKVVADKVKTQNEVKEAEVEKAPIAAPAEEEQPVDKQSAADKDDASAKEAVARLLQTKEANEEAADEEAHQNQAPKLSKGQKKRMKEKKKKAKQAEGASDEFAALSTELQNVSVQNLDKGPTWGAMEKDFYSSAQAADSTIGNLLNGMIEKMESDKFWADLARPIRRARDALILDKHGTQDTKDQAAEELESARAQVAAIFLFQDEQRILGAAAKWLRRGATLETCMPESALADIEVTKQKVVLNVMQQVQQEMSEALGIQLDMWAPGVSLAETPEQAEAGPVITELVEGQ